jgi:DNA-directed RNA polymerase specialized sigma24 family protein
VGGDRPLARRRGDHPPVRPAGDWYGRRFARDYDAELAADAAIDVLIRVAPKYDAAYGVPFPAYFAFAMRREVVKRTAEAARRRGPIALGIDVPAWTDATADAADEAEAFLADLPEGHRRAAVLAWRDGWTWEEVAGQLGVPRTTVVRWLREVRDHAARGEVT